MVRRGALFAALVAVLLAALWWWSSRDAGPAVATAHGAESSSAAPAASAALSTHAGQAGAAATATAPPKPAAPGHVEVQVTSGGQPVAGAQVAIHLRGDFDATTGTSAFRLLGRETTAANGRARIAAPAGTLFIAVRAAGFGRAWKPVMRPAAEEVTRVEVPLSPAAALTGRVLTAGGKEPVPLAQISVSAGNQKRDAKAFPAEEKLVVQADARGAFRVDGLAAGAVDVEVSAVGHASVSKQRVAVPGDLEVVLYAGSFLTGQVVDADGKPAAGALVTAIGSFETATTQSTSGGGYSLEVEAGSHRVTATLGAQSAAAPGRFAVAAGQTRQVPLVRLGQGGSIAGTVRDAASKAPLAGATIGLSPHGANGEVGRATTDAAGGFALSGLAAGSYDVDLQAAGHAAFRKRGLAVLAGQKVPLDAALDAAAAVEGIVRDSAGRPVAGALVWVGQEADARQARTGADGGYRLADVAPGKWRLSARREGEASAAHQRVEVRAGALAKQDLTLGDAEDGTVEGAVTLPSGAPAPAGTQVRFVQSVEPGLPVLVDGAGRYSLKVAPGEINVWASAEGDGHRYLGSAEATVLAGQKLRLDLALKERLDDAGDKLSGVVLEADGTPSAGAIVYAVRGPGERAIQTRAAPDGTFSITAGIAQYVALNGGRSGTAAPSGSSISIRLSAPATLRGHVSGGDQPVVRFRVQAYPAGGRLSDREGLSFEGDRFELADLPPGKTAVRVTTDDARLGEAVVELAEGAAAEVEIGLRRVLDLSGRAFEPDGVTPAARATILVRPSEGAGRKSVATPDGRFTVTELVPGDYSLTISTESGWHSRSLSITAGPLDLGDLFLRLRPGTIGMTLGPAGDGEFLVRGLVEGGPASLGGVKVGDLLLTIDGRPVASLSDATARLHGVPGAPVSLGLRRAGAPLSIPVKRLLGAQGD